ncbi:YchJ family metal-binding protein [Rhodococcus aerolatus]
MTARGPGACPCGLGPPYDACCGPLHAGAPAPTAERLMRSRYTAFALADEAYLLASWHPRTRPRALRLDAGQRWTGLEVGPTTGGGPFAAEGTVAFRARWAAGGRTGVLAETSRFVRVDGRWVYLDGVSGPGTVTP